jgi:iron complex outermembrane receptor protein
MSKAKQFFFVCTFLIFSDCSLADRSTTAAPAHATQNLIAPGPVTSYQISEAAFRYGRSSRLSNLSNLLPIMNINLSMATPPLEYVPWEMKDVNLLRGIAPVSAGIEINPGYPSPATPTVPFTEQFEIKGRLSAVYEDAANATGNALGIIASDASNRLIAFGMKVDNDNFTLANGDTLQGSFGAREAFAIGYGRRFDRSTLSYTFMKNSADDTGAPGLTLDINYVDIQAHIVSYELTGDNWLSTAEVRHIDINRLRDSYNYRPWFPDQASATGFAPNPAQFTDRDAHIYLSEINSLAAASQQVDSWEYRFDLVITFDNGSWTSGIDGVLNDVEITARKPANDPRFASLPVTPAGNFAPADWANFRIDNFAEENNHSIFSEIDLALNNKNQLYAGLRITRHEMDNEIFADESGLNGRFVYEVLDLRYLLENIHGINYYGGASFTPVNLNNSEETFDLVTNLTHTLNEHYQLSLSLAHYQEQPSSLERIFPAPLDPAAAFMDGHVYMGNIGLEAEKHYRLETAISYDNLQNFTLTARLHFDRIDDYIQGVPVLETTNNAQELEAYYELACGSLQYDPTSPYLDNNHGVSFDCIDDNPLRMDNISAEIYGADLNWGYRLNENWLLYGSASYQRGKRRDNGLIHTGDKLVNQGIVTVRNDDLYRLLPPHASIKINYNNQAWQAALESHLYMAQDHVSRTNNELKTGGYGVFNALITYKPHPAFKLDVGVNNLFDKQYTDHLTAVNRHYNPSNLVNVVEAGERIMSPGRNPFVRLTLGIKWPLPKNTAN